MKHTEDETKTYMSQMANKTRDLADEYAAWRGGCDDPLYPHGGLEFQNYKDFIRRVCVPLVEIEDNEAVTQTAMALYRKWSPYSICVSMVMMANRIDALEAKVADLKRGRAIPPRQPELRVDAGERNLQHQMELDREDGIVRRAKS